MSSQQFLQSKYVPISPSKAAQHFGTPVVYSDNSVHRILILILIRVFWKFPCLLNLPYLANMASEISSFYGLSLVFLQYISLKAFVKEQGEKK